jgi:hypothetical protein
MRTRVRNAVLPILAIGLPFWPIVGGWAFLVVLVVLTTLALWLSLRRPMHRRGPDAHIQLADRKEQLGLSEEARTEAERRAPTGVSRHGMFSGEEGWRRIRPPRRRRDR